jgi:excisionase family DNA binding protein
MDMLTVEEVAQELRVSPRTVRSYIASGRLAVFPIGGKGYRIKRDDLNAFIAQTIEERAQGKGFRRKRVTSTKKTAYSQDETVTVELPRALVEQLAEYDSKMVDLFGIDGFIAAICREWHGEEVLKKTKARAEKLFFSKAKEAGEETEAESKPQPYIFQVRNHQVESCGMPPHFDNPDGAYLSYYENRYGEQNIFVYNYQTKEAFLYMGDAGWERPRQVIEGGKVPGLIYGEDEAMWLFACWMATHYEEAIQMFRNEAKKGARKR